MTSPKRAPDSRINDIVEAARTCIDWTKATEAKTIFEDTKLFDALCRRMSIIGEAANHLPTEYRTEMSVIPWRKIVAMRNLLVHRYWFVDRGLLLLIVHNELPNLVSVIEGWRTARAEA
jgi:uncharacterized protein with HEPN domain